MKLRQRESISRSGHLLLSAGIVLSAAVLVSFEESQARGTVWAQGGGNADKEAKETKEPAPVAQVDRLLLKDGKTLECTLLDVLDGEYVLKTKDGKRFLPASSVKEANRFLSEKRIVAWAKDAKTFEGVDKLRRFALFLRDKQAFPEERICWRRLLALKPNDPEAPLALGQMQLDGQWLSEKDTEARLQAGYVAAEGKLVKKSPITVVKDKSAKASESTKSTTESKSAGKKEDSKKTEARTIKALDHLARVLDEKDAHSLWMLLKRSGIFFVRDKEFAAEVNLKSCERLIEYISSHYSDYKAEMGGLLNKLGVPRDWQAYNNHLVEEFKSKHPQGIHLETRYYHILSTSSKEMTQQLGHNMDVVVDQVYHKIFEFEEKIPYKYILRFWKDQPEFIRNGGSQGVAAYFMPMTKELVGYNLRTTGVSLQDPFQTLFHEGWHQYFDFYIPDAPRWYDEGFAEVIYPTVVKGDKAIRNGFNSIRSATVTQAAGKGQLIPLRELIKMTVAQHYDPARVGLSYAESWSFVYFLTSYTNPDRKIQERVRNFYKDYFWELHKGTDFVEAVDIVFKDVKFDTLEQAWIKAIPHQK